VRRFNSKLRVQFRRNDGWSADSDATTMLSNLGIGESIILLMADLEAKIKVRVFGTSSFGNQIY
jgi:hypothetical protein